MHLDESHLSGTASQADAKRFLQSIIPYDKCTQSSNTINHTHQYAFNISVLLYLNTVFVWFMSPPFAIKR